MDANTDQNPEPDLVFVHDPDLDNDLVLKPNPQPGPGYRGPVPDGHFPGDLNHHSVYDAGGRLVLNGHVSRSLLDAISNLADGLTILDGEPLDEFANPRARVVLPLRAEPQRVTDPVANPNPTSVTFVQPPYTYVGDPPAAYPPTPIYAHSHRHPHTEPDDPLRVAYWHEHPHRHPGTFLDPAGGHRHFYDHGGDASLHDHSHG